MNDFLKGNFKVKNEIKEKDADDSKKSDAQSLMDEFRKKAMSSLGGSMVYVDRTELAWDGDAESEDKDETKP